MNALFPKRGVFFAPVGRKKLIKLSPLNGNIAFCKCKKNSRKKRKILCGKFIFRQRIAFCSDFLTPHGKKAKKMAARFFHSSAILKRFLSLKTQNERCLAIIIQSAI